MVVVKVMLSSFGDFLHVCAQTCHCAASRTGCLVLCWAALLQDKRRTLEALESRMSGNRNEVAAAEARVSAAEIAVTKRETQVAADAAAAADKAAEAERWVLATQ